MTEEPKDSKIDKEKEEQHERSDYESKWKRALADYRNLEKRIAKRQRDFAKISNRDLILRLLPILDDLEEAAVKSEDAGYEKILRKFRGVLRDEGVEEIGVQEGQEFDPRIMEGVQPRRTLKEDEKTQKEKERNGDGDKQKVVNKVVRRGYNMKGELLRPARVIVGN